MSKPRPDGWLNPYNKSGFLHPDSYEIAEKMVHDAYEAGADAIYEPAYQKGKKDLLTELRNSIEPRMAEMAYRALAKKNGHEYHPPMQGGKTGVWAFIPNDREEVMRETSDSGMGR